MSRLLDASLRRRRAWIVPVCGSTLRAAVSMRPGAIVCSARGDDLVRLAEARPHDLRLVVVLLVIVVDANDRGDAWILSNGDVLDAPIPEVEVVDAADEGRDQLDLRLPAGHRLAEREQQRDEVGVGIL